MTCWQAGMFPPPPRQRAARSNDECSRCFIIHKLPSGVVGILIPAVLAAASPRSPLDGTGAPAGSTAHSAVTISVPCHRTLLPTVRRKHSANGMCSCSAPCDGGVWGMAQMAVGYANHQIGRPDRWLYRVPWGAGEVWAGAGFCSSWEVCGSPWIRARSFIGLVSARWRFLAVWRRPRSAHR